MTDSLLRAASTEHELLEMEMRTSRSGEPSLWGLFRELATGQDRWLHVPEAKFRHMSASLVYQDEPETPK